MDSYTHGDSVGNTQGRGAGTERVGRRWSRLHLGVSIVLALLIVGAAGYFGSDIYSYKRHRFLSDRMSTAIAHLAFHRPDGLTDSQWGYCVAWTYHLHANCGVVPAYMPTADLKRIVEELEAKIDAGPNLSTIDWLWDEYARCSSVNYQRYRPTSKENWAQRETEGWDGWEGDLADYQFIYESRIPNK